MIACAYGRNAVGSYDVCRRLLLTQKKVPPLSLSGNVGGTFVLVASAVSRMLCYFRATFVLVPSALRTMNTPRFGAIGVRRPLRS